MEVFWIIFLQIIPIFIKVTIGFIAGRFMNVDRDSIATLIFYLIAPIFFFYSVSTAGINISTIFLPILLYSISCFICILFYNIGKFMWKDSTSNLLAFTAGNGNAGYFGLPIVMQILDKENTGIYIIAMLGITLYENSLGFFITSKNISKKEILARILKLPMIYAFLFGCLINILNINIHPMFDNFMINIRGCYSMLGMMLIGLGLSSIKNLSIDFKFIIVSLFARFIIWPIIIFSLIYLDKNFTNIYNQNIYNILIILSIIPLAANTVLIASIMNIHPDKAASAVISSMIVALFYIPFMISIFVKS